MNLRCNPALLGGLLALGIGGAGCKSKVSDPPPPVQQAVTPATPASSAPADPCDSIATQVGMNACYGQKAKLADSLEQAAFTAARNALKGKGADDRVAQLEAAEQAWAAYRDAECQAEAGLNEGGSVVPLVIATCRAGLADRRAEELKEVYQEWAKQ